MSKHILVTGGSGFIGQNLTAKLIQKNYQVSTLNHLSVDLSKQRPNIQKLKKVDVMVHLASNNNINYSLKHPAGMLQENTRMLLNLLEPCRKNYLKPLIIFTSTTRVYSKTKKNIVDEAQKAYPLDPYTASKIYCELLLELYKEQYDIPYIILRLDSVYGPFQPKHMFIADVIQKMMNQDEILVGNLNIKKNSIYVSDAAEAIMTAISSAKACYNNIYNIAGRQANLREIFGIMQAIFKKKLNKTIKTRFDPLLIRRSDTRAKPFKVSIKKAKKKLNWQPKITLAKGLEKTIDYFLKSNHSPASNKMSSWRPS